MGLAALVLAAAAAAPFSIQVARPATNLEAHTGVWEARVGPDEIVGFSLEVIADVPFGTMSLRNTPQNVRFIRLDTYERKNGWTNRSGRSTFTWWNSDMRGAFFVRNGVLHFREKKPYAVSLDLVYDDSTGGWHGRYSTPYYSESVTLTRPRMNVSGAPAGTWIRTSDRAYDSARNQTLRVQCLYAGLGEDGQLVLWGQYVRTNAEVPKIAEAGAFEESYGETLSDTLTTHTGDRWSFMLANGMWSERITGTVSAGGSQFAGQASDHQGNGIVPFGNPPQPFVWRRAVGDACLP